MFYHKVILDPHAPLTWATKQHFVQNPSRYDTLKSLASEEGFDDSLVSAPGSGREVSSGNAGAAGSGSSSDRSRRSRRTSYDSEDDEGDKFDSRNRMIGIFLAAISGKYCFKTHR